MSFPPNPDFDKFIYKSSDLRTKEPSKEQYIQIEANTGASTGTFETFVNTYLYKIVGNKYQLLGDKKIVIQETDEVVITNKNGKIVKVIKDPINSSEEEETIEVIEDGEPVVKTFTTLYYSYERKNNPETLCRNLIDVTTEFYLNRSLPSVFNFSTNTDKLFTDQVLKTPFNGDNQWFGVSRIRSTSSPEVIIQIGTDGTVLEVFECPLPSEVSTDIRTVSINFENPENSIPAPPTPVDPVFPPEVDDPGPPTVSATFDTSGGTLIGAQSGPSPLYVSQPPNPTKGGFIFNGFSPTLPAVITEDTVFTAIFTPVPPTIGLPDVVTSLASSIKADSAVIGGHVINANNSPVESRGSVFREIIASSNEFTSIGNITNFLNEQTPIIKPEPLQGVRQLDGSGNQVRIWVYDGTTWVDKGNNVNNYLDIEGNVGITSDGEGLGIFVSELEGLNSGREYIYRAYATNADSDGQDQVNYGDEESFETTPLDIQTSVPFDITFNSAQGGGLILNTGNLAILSRGLLLIKDEDLPSASSLAGLDPSRTVDTFFTLNEALTDALTKALNPTDLTKTSKITVIPDTGDLANSLFRLDLGELEFSADYKVRAYATNARGTNEGAIKEFKALDPAEPTVKILDAPTKTFTSITVQAEVTKPGDAPLQQKGILLVPGSVPDPETDTTGVIIKVKDTDNIGTYTEIFTNLDPGTQYTVRAFAINEFGTGYSNPEPVTTNPAQKPTVRITGAFALTGKRASGQGIVDSSNGAPVISRGIEFKNTTQSPTQTLEVLAGTGIGTFSATSGVLGDVGDTIEIRAFAVNSVGTELSAEVDKLTVTLVGDDDPPTGGGGTGGTQFDPILI